MALLGQIRNRAGLLIVVIGLAMFAFILTDLLQGATSMLSPANSVGNIYGEDVSYQELSDIYNINLQGNQFPEDPDKRAEVLQTSWDQLMNQKVMHREYESAGVGVTGEELYTMFMNPPINSEVRNIAAFKDSLGRFSPALVKQILEVTNEPDVNAPNYQQLVEFKEFLGRLEEFLYQNRLQQKYFSIVKGAMKGSNNEARRKYYMDNRRFDISFLAVNFSTISDSSVSISDADVRDYYSAHRSEYPQESESIIRYVLFPKTPSMNDTLSAFDGITKLKKVFAGTANDSSFVRNYNGNILPDYYGLEVMPPQMQDSISIADSGQVFGPLLINGSYTLYKVSDLNDGSPAEGEEATPPAYKLRHIQINIAGPTKEDSVQAKRDARGIKSKLNAGNFLEVMKENTSDLASIDTDGELNWMSGNSPFGETFTKDLEGRKPGDVFVTSSSLGYHVVEVLDVDSRKYIVSQIGKEIFAGSETLKNVFRAASRFATEVHDADDIDLAAKDADVGDVRVSNPAINSKTSALIGVAGAMPMINWALGSELGSICDDVIETQDAYVVAMVTEKSTEGVKSLESIRASIENAALYEKKADMIKEKIANLNASTLEDMKSSYGQGADIFTASGVNFNSPSIQRIGTAKFIIGRVTGMEQGEVSKPLSGLTGVYVIRIDKVDEAPEITDNELQSRIQQLNFGSQTNIENKVFQGLLEMADVEDLRYKFDF